MGHRHTEKAEKYLDVQYNVHNYGFIQLVDYMGNDDRIVEAARQSTTGDVKGIKKDTQLLRYMYEHGHTSPFEMVETVWKIKLPIVVMRQLIRHRTASVNEYSGRYSKMKPEFYVPNMQRAILSGQSKSNAQSSGVELDEDLAVDFCFDCVDEHERSWDFYEQYLDKGFAKEMARINLPLSVYTTCMWKMDLHNLLNFFYKRLPGDAQYEIRAYAVVMWPILQAIVPIACKAFEDYRLNAWTLEAAKAEKLRELISYLDRYEVNAYVNGLVNDIKGRS